MSSRSYHGRHRGKHRKPATRPTVRLLTPSVVLPGTAAAALVITATGANVAQSSPLTLDLTEVQAQAARTQAASESADQATISARRQEVPLQIAAQQGRAAEQQRVARDKARIAAAEKAARAKLAREGKRWVPAVEGATFTSGYGMRWGRMHNGNDFGCPIGTPLRAMSKGVVTYAAPMGTYGNLVKIRYWDGVESYYAHMDSFAVKAGDQVMPGDVVGASGNTGRSTGPHVHLEIRPGDGAPIDPGAWLRSKGLQ